MDKLNSGKLMKYLLNIFIFSAFCLSANVPKEAISGLKYTLENLEYVRNQMDCYYDKIDGKIEAYEEIIKFLEDFNEGAFE